MEQERKEGGVKEKEVKKEKEVQIGLKNKKVERMKGK